jgi:amino acid adenylation domain-containing protein
MSEGKPAKVSADARRAILAKMLGARALGVVPRDRLSENQRGMWFVRQLAPTSAAYNIAFAITIRSQVDVEALRKALQGLVDRHAILRTTYSIDAGEPLQVVHAHQAITFGQESAAERDDRALRDRVSEVIQEPFDLDHGPVLRTRLFTRSETCHVFLLVVHHIAFDGWSTWLLLDELRALYQAAAAGSVALLPPPACEYRDFVQWQADLLSGEHGTRARQYWHRQLGGELPVLNLPGDRARSEVRLGRVGASVPFALSRASIDRARVLARTEGATLYMVLVAAYQVLLHRYTGQEDILVGSPVSGRSASQFESVVGCFVNSVTLRGDLRGTPTSRAFLRRTRRIVLDALEYQDYPFRLLTEELRPTRDLKRPSLFQTDFALHKPQSFKELADIFFANGNTSGRQIDFGGLAVECYEVHQQGGQLDLSVEMLETGTDVVGVFRYDPDLFDQSTISRMIASFQIVLDGIVSEPDTPVSMLRIMPPDEQHTVLVEWNATGSAYPEERCIHELIEEQVKRTPGALAVIEPGRSATDRRQLTYLELNTLANRVAHRLRALGIGSDDRVGLCLGRSLEMIVGVLGILKAGGAYVPLDPGHPGQRLRAMLDDSGARVLLVARGREAQHGHFTGAVVGLHIDGDIVTADGNDVSSRPARPDSLAYVMYTSGSSGRPKGVMVEHRSLVNYTVAAAAQFELTQDDRVLQFASVGFDTAAEEIFPCLARGGALVLRPEGALPTVDDFVKMSEAFGLTVWDLPTAYWHQLVDELGRRSIGLPPALRLVVIGGERAFLERVQSWSTLTGGRIRLLNTYGPTEATIVALSCDLTSNASVSSHCHVPIGRPVKNVHAYVLDAYQQPVPPGVVGELYLGGVGIARGYLNDPEQTAFRFVPTPLKGMEGSGLEGDRLFRTGDFVRRLSNGNLDFIGRVDDQIKIRGVRVEVGEVEAALLQHPLVREAAVVAHGDDRGEYTLSAYVAGQPATTPPPAELREHLRPRLPAEMIPTSFVLMEALPRTVNGKIDRRALRPPDETAPLGGSAPVAPRTATERAIAEIYTSVLRVEAIGVDDNFFDRGGHSLSAMQAITRMRETFGVEVQVRAIFDLPTIAEMAAYVEALGIGEREEIVL